MFLSGAAGSMALTLYALDQLDEADDWAVRAADLGASDDVSNGMLWRRIRAKVRARRGDLAEAERLAREAVAMGENTESPNEQGDANADLAEVLLLADRRDEAVAAFETAIERYEKKGNIVSARRARARVADLRDP
jgi:tetratricopeptide (TPR) repeat protein